MGVRGRGTGAQQDRWFLTPSNRGEPVWRSTLRACASCWSACLRSTFVVCMMSLEARSGCNVGTRLDQGRRRDCGVRAAIEDRAPVVFVGLPCFGRPTRLVWHKQRWWCREPVCAAGSWTIVDERIAWPRAALTDRAARWATTQVGRVDRSVNEVAQELGCDWHTVNDVVAYGEALLAADADSGSIGGPS